MSKKLTPLQALEYLDDIAHGRKMKYDAHELKCIVENALINYSVYKQDYERVMKEKNLLLKECAKWRNKK